MERPPESLSEAQLLQGPDRDAATGLMSFVFELRLESELFPPLMGGAQHLVGMLAGDLLRFTLPPIRLERWAHDAAVDAAGERTLREAAVAAGHQVVAADAVD